MVLQIGDSATLNAQGSAISKMSHVKRQHNPAIVETSDEEESDFGEDFGDIEAMREEFDAEEDKLLNVEDDMMEDMVENTDETPIIPPSKIQVPTIMLANKEEMDAKGPNQHMMVDERGKRPRNENPKHDSPDRKTKRGKK